MAKAAAVSGMCLVIAAAAIEIGAHLDPNIPGPNPDHPWVVACVFVALAAVIIALLTVTLGVATSIEQRRSRSSCRPARGQAAAPWTVNGTTGPAITRVPRFPHRPDPNRPASS